MRIFKYTMHARPIRMHRSVVLPFFLRRCHVGPCIRQTRKPSQTQDRNRPGFIAFGGQRFGIKLFY